MRNGYYWRDAASMVTALPDCSIDVTVTSPPYGAMKDYGTKGQIGFGQTYEEYLRTLVNIFAALHRKTRASGSLWVVVDTFKEKSELRLLPFDLAARLSAVGWHLKDIIIWNKTKTLPWSARGQLRRTFEYVLFFAKSRDFKYYVDRIKEPDNLKEWWVKYPERYSPDGKVPTNIWTFPIPVQGSWSKIQLRHFCPFPAQLVERIVALTTDPGDCVLDPFAGTGVVLAQAKAMRRRYVGCDVNKNFRQQFQAITTDHVSKHWRKTKKLRVQNGSKQVALAENICKLRETKFPKTLFKQLQRSLGRKKCSQIRAIIALARRMEDPSAPHCFSAIRVEVYCTAEAAIGRIESTARDVVRKPPLSKFGIIPEIHVSLCRDGQVTTAAGERTRLFLYAEGATHDYVSELRRRGWLRAVPQTWKRIPPIVSNIGIRQMLVKTWRSSRNT